MKTEERNDDEAREGGVVRQKKTEAFFGQDPEGVRAGWKKRYAVAKPAANRLLRRSGQINWRV